MSKIFINLQHFIFVYNTTAEYHYNEVVLNLQIESMDRKWGIAESGKKKQDFFDESDLKMMMMSCSYEIFSNIANSNIC